MTKKAFVTLRVLIVAFTLFVLGWLFFSRPSINPGLSDFKCQPVAWNYLGTPYGMYGFFDIEDGDMMDEFAAKYTIDNEKDRAEARLNVTAACNLAREDRRLYMILLTVVAATAFITLPKPKQKQTASKAEETTSKEKEPASKEHGEDENEEN